MLHQYLNFLPEYRIWLMYVIDMHPDLGSINVWGFFYLVLLYLSRNHILFPENEH